MPVVLAVDQGTSGTKAVVVDPAEGVLAVAEVPVRPTYLADGGVEQDPDALLQSVLDAGRQAIAGADRPVEVVALANQGETVLAWDPHTGVPLSAAVVWQDRRAQSVLDPLADAAGWVAQRTGLVLDPYFSAPKMAWLRHHRTRAGVVTTTDTWLLNRLTGAFVTDAATASRSLLLDLDTGAWDPQLLELFNLQDERLPEIVDCDATVGTTTAFGAPVPVAGVIVDQQAALLAQGGTARGAAKCTFGTGAFLLANTGDVAVRSADGLASSIAWQLRGRTTYCLDAQIFTAGSAVRWLVDVGLIGQVADIDQVAVPDADTVLCVPAFAGLGAPWWRPAAGASFVGIGLATGRGELVRAVVLGVAAQLAELVAAVTLDLGTPLQRLRVDGGLVRCRTLVQALADLTRLPVELYPGVHATALGAAALAQLACDADLAPADAVPASETGRTFEPQWPAERAADYRERWVAALQATTATGTTS